MNNFYNRNNLNNLNVIQTPIPHCLMQTWKTYDLPANMLAFHTTWREKHPTWTFVLMNDQDIDHYAKQHFPQYYHTFTDLPHQIQRVDMVRYMWLYVHGGVYADLDMQCLRPMDKLIHQFPGRVVLGHENEKHKDGTERVGNAIMCSSRGHPFWLFVLEEVEKRHLANVQSGHKQFDVTIAWNTTGPHMLHEVFQAYERLRNHDVYYPAVSVSTISTVSTQPMTKWPPITVLPCHFFYPKKWEKYPKWGLLKASDFPESYAAHHWAGTWIQYKDNNSSDQSNSNFNSNSNSNSNSHSALSTSIILIVLTSLIVGLLWFVSSCKTCAQKH